MRRMFKILAALSVAVSALPASAEYYENDGKYIYRITPFSEMFKEQDAVKQTAEIAYRALFSVLDSMKAKQILPEEVATVGDIEKLRRSRDNVDALVEYLNGFVREQRQRANYEMTVVPSAFMIFGGGKLTLKGISGSISAGAVVMPVYVDQINAQTGKVVDSYTSLRSALVAWPSGDVGMGLGGGSKARVGMGFIYDLNSAFMRPEDFWGAGLGVSFSTPALGWNWNAKSGFLSNTDLPGVLDFFYATAAIEFGPAAEVSTPRANMTVIMSGTEVLNAITGVQRKMMEEANKEMNRKLNDMMKELRPRFEDGEQAPEDSKKQESTLPPALQGYEGVKIRD